MRAIVIVVVGLVARTAVASPYVVRVVDEQSRPLAGVEVHAFRDRMIEGYGDVAMVTDKLGVATTNAAGKATIDVASPKNVYVYAVKTGWPIQLGEGGVIVLGPARTITGRYTFTKCSYDPTPHIRVLARYELSADGTPQPGYHFGNVGSDHTFTVTGLGPGRYHVQIDGCDQVGAAEIVGRTQKAPLAIVLRPR